MERFPTRYLRLTTRLLSQMKEQLPQPMVSDMFKQVATTLAAEHEQQLIGLNVEERLNVMKELLGEEGFVVEWEKKGQDYLSTRLPAPIFRLGMFILKSVPSTRH